MCQTQSPSDQRYQIKTVELEITNVCSHYCPYCYNGDLDKSNVPFFSPVETLYKIIDKVASYGAEKIILLGGDPATHPKLIDLLRYIKQHTHMMVVLMSNTLEFKNSNLAEIAPLIDEVQLTVHGATAEEHETFCKAKHGTYRTVVTRLKELQSHGIHVAIAINIIPQTHLNIYNITNAIITQGVAISSLLLQRILPCGRAEGTDIYNVNKAQIKKVFQQLQRIENEMHIDISFEDPFPLCYVEPHNYKFIHPCPGGISKIALKGDGSIMSCVAIADSGIGNILTDTYEDAWVHNRFFESLRNMSYLTNEKCSACPLSEKCRGGCPTQYISAETEGDNFYDKFER